MRIFLLKLAATLLLGLFLLGNAFLLVAILTMELGWGVPYAVAFVTAIFVMLAMPFHFTGRRAGPVRVSHPNSQGWACGIRVHKRPTPVFRLIQPLQGTLNDPICRPNSPIAWAFRLQPRQGQQQCER